MILPDIVPSLRSALIQPIKALTSFPRVIYAHELLPRFLTAVDVLQTTVVPAGEVSKVVEAHCRG